MRSPRRLFIAFIHWLPWERKRRKLSYTALSWRLVAKREYERNTNSTIKIVQNLWAFLLRFKNVCLPCDNMQIAAPFCRWMMDERHDALCLSRKKRHTQKGIKIHSRRQRRASSGLNDPWTCFRYSQCWNVVNYTDADMKANPHAAINHVHSIIFLFITFLSKFERHSDFFLTRFAYSDEGKLSFISWR